jgi:hypothetical protein
MVSDYAELRQPSKLCKLPVTIYIDICCLPGTKAIAAKLLLQDELTINMKWSDRFCSSLTVHIIMGHLYHFSGHVQLH